jgi:serine/threonine protein kinase
MSKPDHDPASRALADLLATLRLDQLRRWRAGERVPAEDYLRRYPTLQGEAALALIYAEFLLRDELDEDPQLEEYQQRFPQHADRLRQQLEFRDALDAGPATENSSLTEGVGPTAPHRELGPGAVLGQYLLLELLGEGGMGRVWKARHQLMQRLVALKVIQGHFLADAGTVARFQREIRAAAQLDHPHLVRALDADEVAGTHFFVMEYVAGTDLARLVKEQGPLPVARACDYVRQAALGLQHAHEKGLVHRDVKPGNLFLAADGTVKVLDLGLASLVRAQDVGSAASDATPAGALLGTPDYLAPEQARDARSADGRADLYGLGCTLYHLLTGRPPFPAGTLAEKLLGHQLHEPKPVAALRPEVAPGVAAVVGRLMAKRPEDRYPTAAAAAAALAPFAGDGRGRPLPAPRRHGWLLPLAAAVILLVALSLLLRWAMQPGPLSRSDLAEEKGSEFVLRHGGTGTAFARDTAPSTQPERRAPVEAALAALVKLGATISVDEQKPGKPLGEISLQGTKAEDNDLIPFEALREGEHPAVLWLEGTKIGDPGLEHLRGLTGLKSLGLARTQITDAGLIHLRDLGALGYLDLSDTRVTEDGLKHLKPLRELRCLEMKHMSVGDAGLRHLEGLPRLKSLVFSGAPIGDRVVERLQNWTQLRSLNFSETQVGDGGLAALARLTELEWLALNGTPISNAGLGHLEGLKRLQHLELARTQTGDVGLAHLQGLSQLQQLDLSDTPISNEGLKLLAGLPLETLGLEGTRIGDAGLKHLHGLLRLKSLDLRNTRVTPSGIKELQTALPAVQVSP